jgi:hypothetical protein
MIQAGISLPGSMMGGMMRRVMGRPLPAVRDRKRVAASLADVGAVPAHANADFRDVGYELVAEPHDVRRTSLLLLRGALRCGRRRGECHGQDQS